MGVKPPELPKIPDAIQRLLDVEPNTVAPVHGGYGDDYRVGLVLKRTYWIDPEGRWELAPPDEQEFVVDGLITYEEVEPPRVSPVALDDDSAAFRSRTDVVVQATAQTYGTPRHQTTVGLRVADFHREIRVWGDRRAELAGGQLRFSNPEPFDELPVTYDYAYGGFDSVANERYMTQAFYELLQARPELAAATPYHYPRNPAGVGFLIDVDEESVAKVEVPNLEFAQLPVTPEHMCVGSVDNWPAGPLPACMDWTALSWFPRCAYLGLTRRPEGYTGTIQEIELGWAPPDLLETPSALQTLQVREGLAQAASPGMSFDQIVGGTRFELTNLHPERPTWSFELPHEVPDAHLELRITGLEALVPHLNAVVIRPDFRTVVMTWCASAPAERRFSPEQMLNLRRQIDWRAQQ